MPNKNDGTEELDYSDPATGHLTIDDEIENDDTDASIPKFKKTNSINVSKLELEAEDYFDHTSIGDAEHEREPSLPNWKKVLKQQVPFFYNLIFKNKKNQKSNVSDSSVATGGQKNFLEKHLPFLSKLIPSKKLKTEFKTDPDVGLELDEESQKKKKRGLTPIHILVIVGLAVFLFMDDEEETVTKAPVVAKQKNIPKKKIEAKPDNENIIRKDPQVVINDETNIDQNTHPVENQNSDQNTHPVENQNGDQNTVSEASSEQVIFDNPSNTVVENFEEDHTTIEKKDNELNDLFKEDLKSPEEVYKDNEEQKKIHEKDTDRNNVVSEEDVSENEEETTPLDNAADVIEVSEGEVVDINITGAGSDISTKILQELEGELKNKSTKKKSLRKVNGPTAPPNYDLVGMGLVYNCVDRHWACVDKSAHDICEKNYAWNSSKGLAIECYPMEVYEQDEMCQYIQQQKINTATAIDFCKNN